MYGQQLHGEVFSQGPLEKVEVANKRTKKTVFTNWKGRFEIQVAIGDYLIFFREGYGIQKKRITSDMLEHGMRVDMGKKVINLEEVVVRDGQITEHFNINDYNNNLQSQLQTDIQNNPHLYQPNPLAAGGNILGLVTALVDLFRDKKQERLDAEARRKANEILKFSHYEKMRKISFYTDTLKVPKEKLPEFFYFCETKGVKKQQFIEMQPFKQMDVLFKLAQTFQRRMEEGW